MHHARAMSSRLTTAIFDLGGVLIDWDPRHLYRQLFGPDEAGMERFLTEVCSAEWNAQMDAGRPWSEAVDELAARHPDQRELIVAFHERWTEMLRGPIDDSVAILAELRAARVRLYALSNWSAETFPVALERYPFLGWFEGVVISGEAGFSKPDPRIYHTLFERHDVIPGASVFIDDRQENVDAAAALGMTAIRFYDPGGLRSELLELGLLRQAA
jgi:2-haloacid dehalogenase